jgi:hypothetical protein
VPRSVLGGLGLLHMHASIGLLLVCGKANCPLLESNQGGCKIFSFLSGRHAYIFIELLWLRVTRKMAGAGASNALAISLLPAANGVLSLYKEICPRFIDHLACFCHSGNRNRFALLDVVAIVLPSSMRTAGKGSKRMVFAGASFVLPLLSRSSSFIGVEMVMASGPLPSLIWKVQMFLMSQFNSRSDDSTKTSVLRSC